MVSSNHSFWCSGPASRTPHRRMWENNSSRACSNRVGVDILRGSERFLVMRGVLLSLLGLGAWARGGAVARPPMIWRRNVISGVRARKGPTTERLGDIIINEAPG